MIGILLALALSQQPTVAVIPAPDKPAIIMERGEAEALFDTLCKNPEAEGIVQGVIQFDKQWRIRSLTAEVTVTNDQMLRALAASLNPMPDWSQFVMNNEPSVCNRNPKAVTPVPLSKQGKR